MKKEPAKYLNFPKLKRKIYQTTHPGNPGNFKQDKCQRGGKICTYMLAKQLKPIVKEKIFQIARGKKRNIIFRGRKNYSRFLIRNYTNQKTME